LRIRGESYRVKAFSLKKLQGFYFDLSGE